MKTVLTIIKKEFSRFFKDTRLWLTAIILPGLLIFAVYSIMGGIIESVQEREEKYIPTAVAVNLPDSLSPVFSQAFELKEGDIEDSKQSVKDGKLDILMVFPQDFDGLIAEYSPASGQPAPNVEIYYNSSESKSLSAYGAAEAILSAFEDAAANLFDINRPAEGAVYDFADAGGTSRMILSMIVPMILLMLLFSGCMAVAPESIAGEKERGTIATLLVTPVKRGYIAVGKIAALSVIALLSGLSSCLGMMLSLPKLAGAESGLTISMLTAGDYIALLGVVMSTVLALVAIIAIISAYSKSVKEAGGLVVPVMLLTMLCGVLSMFVTAGNIGWFFIPLFNSALAVSAIISGALTGAYLAVTICVNIVFTAALVLILAKMFGSERIMFNR